MRALAPNMQVLPQAQRVLWPELRGVAELGFVLYGGTAIALRLGHRSSVDFDFFSHELLDRRELGKSFEFISRSRTIQDEENTWTLLVPVGETGRVTVKLSFFGQISFGRVGEPELTDDGVLVVASLEDLMATKLKVMLQRVEAKDYRDIAAMIDAGVDLSRGMACASALYGLDFQPAESLKALVYFEGGDLQTLSEWERFTLVQAARAVRDLPKVESKFDRLTS